MTEPTFSDIEKRAEQFILQMVRYWSDNTALEDPKYGERSIAVDSGGMHTPYKLEVSRNGRHRIVPDISGSGWTQRGFYKESFKRSR